MASITNATSAYYSAGNGNLYALSGKKYLTPSNMTPSLSPLTTFNTLTPSNTNSESANGTNVTNQTFTLQLNSPLSSLAGQVMDIVITQSPTYNSNTRVPITTSKLPTFAIPNSSSLFSNQDYSSIFNVAGNGNYMSIDINVNDVISAFNSNSFYTTTAMTSLNGAFPNSDHLLVVRATLQNVGNNAINILTSSFIAYDGPAWIDVAGNNISNSILNGTSFGASFTNNPAVTTLAFTISSMNIVTNNVVPSFDSYYNVDSQGNFTITGVINNAGQMTGNLTPPIVIPCGDFGVYSSSNSNSVTFLNGPSLTVTQNGQPYQGFNLQTAQVNIAGELVPYFYIQSAPSPFPTGSFQFTITGQVNPVKHLI